ncbi:hypothetical protein V6N12_003952 [Hibiscus sabdariffa]|uniref:non-specific serine/threonine protein kinase n=1 Tax=Hibiscus sabdariffa TaxID=183260 RepID=A0ABR2CJZ7_9ROSI
MYLFSFFIFIFLSNNFALSLQQQNPSNEVMAMLGFKQNSVAADPQGFLNDWRLESITPCSWRGVSCSLHGKVTVLNFTDAGLIGRLHMDDLMVLENLKHLHLSGNLFSGNLFLNKSSHPSCIIETLDLSFNNLSEPISETFFSSCSHLVSLNLSHNSVPGDIPAVLVSDFSKSLKSLDLSHNNLSDDFPMLEFKNCSNLVAINLSNNSLYGTRILRSLTNCQLLENLDVSLNKLEGTIPASLGNLRNLKHLNLAQNTVSGNIPPEMGSTCGTLTALDLSVISYLPSLQILQVPFNNISGFIPVSLTNCTELQVLDLSSNGFDGEIPSGLCSNSSLRRLLLADNFLSGTIPADIGNCKRLETINFARNHLSGPIPSEVWKLPNVHDFVMWGNNFSGEIPKDICSGTRNLEKLALNNNGFSGNILASITNCANLLWLSLSFNRLTGTIPAGLHNLQKLSILQLSYNSFSGNIQTADLGSFKNLIWLDSGSNQFTGHIPSNLAAQKRFDPVFSLSSKGGYMFLRDKGRSDCRLRNSLIYSEGISEAKLQESFESNSCSLITIYGWPNHLIKTSNGTILFMDLSFNHLSGTIPDSIGAMSNLHILDLSHNRLTGNIPDTFQGLKEVCLLNLSYNSLQGRLPGSLGLITFLTDLDVSNNNLTGPIPSTGQLTTFPASRYENNLELCGIPLPPCDHHPETVPISSDVNGKNHSMLRNVDWVWVIAMVGYIFGAAIGVCVGNVMLRGKEEWLLEKKLMIISTFKRTKNS